MIIIIEVLKSNPSVTDRIQIQNFLMEGYINFAISGEISLIDKNFPLMRSISSHISVCNSNPMFDFFSPHVQNSSTPSYPLKYKVNASIFGFNTTTKEEVEKFFQKRSKEAVIYNMKIISYEFENHDLNALKLKKETSSTLFGLEGNSVTKTPTFSYTPNRGLIAIFGKYKQKDETYFPSIEVVLRRAASVGNIEDLKLLVNVKGIDIDSQDSTPGKHFTALHWAAKRGHSEVYQFLIDNGANPNIKDAAQKIPSEYFQDLKNKNATSGFDYSKIFK